jgi:hypothetical protein
MEPSVSLQEKSATEKSVDKESMIVQNGEAHG